MIEMHHFNNYGFLLHKFSDEQLLPIKQEVNEIRNNFDLHASQKHNQNLAGNIRKEYKLIKSADYLQNLTQPLLGEYEKHFNYFKMFDSMTEDAPIVLKTPWVNFQQKHEFNPNHNHKGLMSFVIWLEIPYLIEDELKASPGRESNSNFPAHFEFSYTDALGRIRQEQIPVDKRMQGTICMFPSKLIHTVYPFYTSDEYRVTVSGNFYFKN